MTVHDMMWEAIISDSFAEAAQYSKGFRISRLHSLRENVNHEVLYTGTITLDEGCEAIAEIDQMITRIQEG